MSAHGPPAHAAPHGAPPLIGEVFFWIAALSTSGAFFSYFSPAIGWNEPRAAFAEMVNGTAHRPFAYRVLIPGLASALHLLVPGLSLQTAATGLIYLALPGFIAALRLLCSAFWPITRRLEIVILLAPLGLIPLSLSFRHVYDLPLLCLFTLGLALLARRRWRLFIIVYAVGCLNKETTALLTLVYLVWYWRELPRGGFLRLLIVQGLCFALIRGALMWHFRHNPGGVVEFHLWDHLAIYRQLPGFALFYAAMVAGVALLWARNGRRKPTMLRQAAGVLIGVITPLFVLFGFPFEVRIFYEAFAPVYLLCLPPRIFPEATSSPICVTPP